MKPHSGSETGKRDTGMHFVLLTIHIQRVTHFFEHTFHSRSVKPHSGSATGKRDTGMNFVTDYMRIHGSQINQMNEFELFPVQDFDDRIIAL